VTCKTVHIKADKTNCIVRHGTPLHVVVMAMSLLYGLALWSMCACVGALNPMTRDQ
jgi:hypothetical protein